MAACLAAEGGSEAWTTGTPGRYVAAYLVFLLGWRVASGSLSKGLVLGAWVLGATAMIPSAWGIFFGTAGTGDIRGVLAWFGVAAVNGVAAAAAAGLVRVGLAKRWPRGAEFLGIVVALIVTAVPPVGLIGMTVPLIAAGAFFAGFGVAGYLLLIVFSGWIVCAMSTRVTDTAYGMTRSARAEAFWKRTCLPVTVALLALTAVRTAAHVTQALHPANALPVLVDGRIVDLKFRRPPVSGGAAWFDYQDQMKAEALEALEGGAKLVVLPEGSVSLWDSGSVSYWADLATVARERGAHVLVGAYTRALDHPPGAGGAQKMQNTLIDLTTGQQHAARATLPVGMWRPWAKDGDTYPLSASLGKGTLSVAGMKALFVVCYEEVLVWPLAFASLQGDRPQLIISAASNWYFARDEWHSQDRVIALQAQLYGLPLVRSVSYGPAAAAGL
jgi:hypothetical protein